MADKLGKKPSSLRGPEYEHYGIGHAYRTAWEAGDESTVRSLQRTEDSVGKQESEYIARGARKRGEKIRKRKRTGARS